MQKQSRKWLSSCLVWSCKGHREKKIQDLVSKYNSLGILYSILIAFYRKRASKYSTIGKLSLGSQLENNC